jgi:hypothetical protein
MKKTKSWKTLKHIINNNLLDKLNRTEFQMNRYKIHKFLLKKQNIKIKDFIIKKYLNNISFSLTPNDFPYNISNTILHLLFWINDKALVKDIYFLIKEEIFIKYKRNYPFIYFENPNNLKSIPDIKHYHIFINIS